MENELPEMLTVQGGVVQRRAYPNAVGEPDYKRKLRELLNENTVPVSEYERLQEAHDAAQAEVRRLSGECAAQLNATMRVELERDEARAQLARLQNDAGAEEQALKDVWNAPGVKAAEASYIGDAVREVIAAKDARIAELEERWAAEIQHANNWCALVTMMESAWRWELGEFLWLIASLNGGVLDEAERTEANAWARWWDSIPEPSEWPEGEPKTDEVRDRVLRERYGEPSNICGGCGGGADCIGGDAGEEYKRCGECCDHDQCTPLPGVEHDADCRACLVEGAEARITAVLEGEE